MMLCLMHAEPDMRTTVTIDDELLAKAMEFSGINERSALLKEAFKALVDRETARRSRRLLGAAASGSSTERDRKLNGHLASGNGDDRSTELQPMRATVTIDDKLFTAARNFSASKKHRRLSGRL